MKKVIDFNGNTIEVSIDTPVKTVNGVHYLLSNADRMEITKREQEATSGNIASGTFKLYGIK